MGDEDYAYDAALDALQEELEKGKEINKEDLNELADRIHANHNELMDTIRNQNITLKAIFRTVHEMNEEQRLDHPKFSMLVKMAEEWGLEDGKEDVD